MYFTNKKDLERHKINELHYNEKMNLLKSELSLKNAILKYGSIVGLLLILLMII